MKIGLKAGYDYVAPVVNPYKINKVGEVTRLIMSALADIDEHVAVMNMFSEWWARKMVDIHESASTGKALGWVVKTGGAPNQEGTPGQVGLVRQAEVLDGAGAP